MSTNSDNENGDVVQEQINENEDASTTSSGNDVETQTSSGEETDTTTTMFTAPGADQSNASTTPAAENNQSSDANVTTPPNTTTSTSTATTTTTSTTTSTTTPATTTTSAPTTSPEVHQDIVGDGYRVEHDLELQQDGSVRNTTTFETTDPTADPQITQDLTGTALTYYDDAHHAETQSVLNEIKDYASKIKCEDFQGKGTIDDYNVLFEAASKIATDAKQIELSVDTEGFNEFSQAADELANLFQSFITRLESVSLINDLNFLRAISNALERIWNLSEVFGRFKQTIIATSTVSLPKSAQEASQIIQDVMSEVNCSFRYINHFVDPTTDAPAGSELSDQEKGIIQNAVSAIDTWTMLSNQGMTIAMENNPSIKGIKEVNTSLKAKVADIRSAATKLRTKLQQYNVTL